MYFIYQHYFKFFFVLFFSLSFIVTTPAVIDLNIIIQGPIDAMLFIINFYQIFLGITEMGSTYYETKMKSLSGKEKEQYMNETFKKESLKHIVFLSLGSILCICLSFFIDDIIIPYLTLGTYLIVSWLNMFPLKGISRERYFKRLIELKNKHSILVHFLAIGLCFLDQYFSWDQLKTGVKNEMPEVSHFIATFTSLCLILLYIGYFLDLRDQIKKQTTIVALKKLVENKIFFVFGNFVASSFNLLIGVFLESHLIVYSLSLVSFAFFLFIDRYSNKCVDDFIEESQLSKL